MEQAATGGGVVTDGSGGASGAGAAGADATGRSPAGLLVSTAHALRRKMKNPSASSRRVVEDLNSSKKRNAAGATDEEDSDRESVRSASDAVLSDSQRRRVRRRHRSVSPPPPRGAAAAEDVVRRRPSDHSNRVQRAVNRIAVGQAGARRRLFQRLKRGSRVKKLRSYSASEAGLLLGDEVSGGPMREKEEGEGLQRRENFRRRQRGVSGGSSYVEEDEEEDDEDDFVRGLLAACFGSLGSLALSAASAAVTLCLAFDATSTLLRVSAVFLSLASLASHSALAARTAVDLAEVALGAPGKLQHKQTAADPLLTNSEEVSRKWENDGDEMTVEIVRLNKDDTKGADPVATNSWWSPDHSSFNLRGPNYLTDGVKVPSAPLIYDPITAFVVYAPRGAIRNVTDLPQVRDLMSKFYTRSSEDEEDSGEDSEDNDGGDDERRRLPRFLFSCMNLPLEAPSLRPLRHGTKYAVMVTVFALSDYAKSFKDEDEWPAALRLVDTWIRTSDSDPVMNGRLKGIFNAHDSSSIPRVATKWNAKPVLMASNASFGGPRARTGISLLNHGTFGGRANSSYVEFNIDVGESFSYIARGAIYLIQSRLATMGPLDIAMTVEGRLPEELPETLFLGIVFHKIDVSFSKEKKNDDKRKGATQQQQQQQRPGGTAAVASSHQNSSGVIV